MLFVTKRNMQKLDVYRIEYVCTHLTTIHMLLSLFIIVIYSFFNSHLKP